ncbi:MAG TPA: hypothetical protein VGX00_07185 [Thermoplasmata archaeon]|nr:hypothetical protein [Thermoplasmata archaeon]
MGRRPEAQEERIASAFAPGHVTGIFAPSQGSRDPRSRGSLGAGIVLELGARAIARYRPGESPSIRLASDLAGPTPISEEVVRRLAWGRPGTLRVEVRHELPVGHGFGMSAAGALATALATAAVLRIPRRRAIAVAHLADLYGGGGLGGVAAILGGGLEIRTRPGIPPFGRIRHRRFQRPILLSSLGGPVATRTVLGDSRMLDLARSLARPGLLALAHAPSASTFLRASERFTDGFGIASVELRAPIATLRGTGARVAQAMFGRSLFSVAFSRGGRARLIEALIDRGYPSVELHAARRGARVSAGRENWTTGRPLRSVEVRRRTGSPREAF